jgi:hypothetical protein
MTYAGAGPRSTVIKQADGADTVALFNLSADGVTFDSLGFDGNRANNTDRDCIRPSDHSDITVDNCRIVNFPQNAVAGGTGDRVTVRDCEFNNNGNHDIGRTDGEDNTFHDNLHLGSDSHAVFLGGTGTEVRDITARGFGTDSVISVDTSSAEDWTIDGGTIHDSTDANGVEVEADADTTGEIRDLTVLRMGTNGIQVKRGDVDVIGCKVVACGLAGYRIGGDDSAMGDMLISGCKALNNGQSTSNPGFDFIGTAGGDGVSLSGIVASDDQGTATQSFGVDANANWSNIQVDGYVIEGNASGETDGAAVALGDGI